MCDTECIEKRIDEVHIGLCVSVYTVHTNWKGIQESQSASTIVKASKKKQQTPTTKIIIIMHETHRNTHIQVILIEINKCHIERTKRAKNAV